MSGRAAKEQPTVFITGGAGGLGGATARYLGERGWRVFADWVVDGRLEWVLGRRGAGLGDPLERRRTRAL